MPCDYSEITGELFSTSTKKINLRGNYDFNYQNPESFNFYISLELNNPKIDGEDVNDDFLEDFFKEFIYNETSTDQELDIFWNIIRIVFDYPTMYDNSYMYSNAIVGYFDSFGNSLT